MNIYEIKDAVAHVSPRFFDKETLEFFGQSMSSFKVRTVASRVFIWAPVRYDGKIGHYTFREFDPEKGRLISVKDGRGAPIRFTDEYQIKEFLSTLDEKEETE